MTDREMRFGVDYTLGEPFSVPLEALGIEPASCVDDPMETRRRVEALRVAAQPSYNNAHHLDAAHDGKAQT